MAIVADKQRRLVPGGYRRQSPRAAPHLQQARAVALCLANPPVEPSIAVSFSISRVNQVERFFVLIIVILIIERGHDRARTG